MGGRRWEKLEYLPFRILLASLFGGGGMKVEKGAVVPRLVVIAMSQVTL